MTTDCAIISNAQARHLVMHLQGLTRPPHLAMSPDSLHELIMQIGFVQVDSIQWVERAHHMTLFSRNQTYRPNHLKNLAEKERRLFEHWTHDAAFIPVEFYPWWQHHFRRKEAEVEARMRRWQGDGFLDLAQKLYHRIGADGALRSRDLERPKRDGPAEMWQWHDGKTALEFLWRTGKCAISGRESGFQKVYDLSERTIASQYVADIESDENYCHAAFVDWACRSALQRLGFGTPKEIAHFWELLDVVEVKEWCAKQSDEELQEVIIEENENTKTRRALALPHIVSQINNLPKMPKRIRVLSPFDPVIRDRNRLKWLFGFDYRIEIYVPAAKRKYGYYVFPLLYNDRLIGRIDIKADRKADILVVRRFWLEDKIRWSKSKFDLLEAELNRLCRLCNVSTVVWQEHTPAPHPKA